MSFDVVSFFFHVQAQKSQDINICFQTNLCGKLCHITYRRTRGSPVESLNSATSIAH